MSASAAGATDRQGVVMGPMDTLGLETLNADIALLGSIARYVSVDAESLPPVDGRLSRDSTSFLATAEGRAAARTWLDAFDVTLSELSTFMSTLAVRPDLVSVHDLKRARQAITRSFQGLEVWLSASRAA